MYPLYMIYFIVTTSIFNSCEIRRKQYIKGFMALKQSIAKLNITNYKIIVVENNGLRPTFLTDFVGCDVYYTTNNFIQTCNKGIKELYDILDCIKAYNINDDDFIVKMTGRYILHDNSEFMQCVKLNCANCIIKYGSYNNPVNYKTNDCITGLIGMSCFYIKQIEVPTETECVEWKWAKVANTIEKIHLVNKLGIYICPGTNRYFIV